MSCPDTTGRPIPARDHQRTALPTSMPIVRQPGPPRVMVDDINGRDTLYEIDLTAMPSVAWRVAFFQPPSHLTGFGSTPYVRRLYLHGVTVYFRTAPRYLGRWLRRIDRWIAYANSVVSRRKRTGRAQTPQIGDPGRTPSDRPLRHCCPAPPSWSHNSDCDFTCSA